MAAESNGMRRMALASYASGCLKSFQRCLEMSVSIHPRERSLVDDQVARFSVWASNIGAFAPGRGSLDYRLREAIEVFDVVAGLLEALQYRIQKYVLGTLDQEGSDSPVMVIETLSVALDGVRHEITLLHKISNIIRRASKDTQNQKAATSFQIRDDDGNDAEPLLLEVFRNQIRDRFFDIDEGLKERLARSMLTRRKRILYRRSRYNNLARKNRVPPVQHEIRRPTIESQSQYSADHTAVGARSLTETRKQPSLSASQSVVQSMTKTATTLTPDGYRRASAPSIISRPSTVALNDHEDLRFPPPPCGKVVRRFKKLRKERIHQLQTQIDSSTPHHSQTAKSLLEAAIKNDWEACKRAVGEVICPFCFIALPAEEVSNNSLWRWHVKNDLDPYVCIFESCGLSAQIYSHSQEWLAHMREHTFRWQCSDKSHAPFLSETKDDYIDQMRNSHPGKYPDTHLGVLADKKARILGPMFKSCPLCGTETVDGRLEDHIIGHMRLIALKSLPSYEEDMEDLGESSDDSNGSLRGSHSRSISTIKQHSD
ncbi:hypothetical protein LY76DRAFT_550841, partial [Colletotrichum caudatum]